MPHFAIKKCAKMGQPDKSYVNFALDEKSFETYQSEML